MHAAGAQVQIRPVRGLLDLVQVRELFAEYAAWLGVDLAFQDFAREAASLPGAYVPPRGCLLLACVDGQAAGCVALRPLPIGDAGLQTGEVKRLWVRPAFRQQRIGRDLLGRLIGVAADAGHARLVLDTLPAMQAAQALYRAAGFLPIDPYYDNPLPGAAYFALDLRARGRP